MDKYKTYIKGVGKDLYYEGGELKFYRNYFIGRLLKKKGTLVGELSIDQVLNIKHRRGSMLFDGKLEFFTAQDSQAFAFDQAKNYIVYPYDQNKVVKDLIDHLQKTYGL